jgi:hypothetical protein
VAVTTNVVCASEALPFVSVTLTVMVYVPAVDAVKSTVLLVGVFVGVPNVTPAAGSDAQAMVKTVDVVFAIVMLRTSVCPTAGEAMVAVMLPSVGPPWCLWPHDGRTRRANSVRSMRCFSFMAFS